MTNDDTSRAGRAHIGAAVRSDSDPVPATASREHDPRNDPDALSKLLMSMSPERLQRLLDDIFAEEPSEPENPLTLALHHLNVAFDPYDPKLTMQHPGGGLNSVRGKP